MRFWITVGCFAFFNLLAWVAWCSWQAGRVGTIRIEPEENLLIEDRRTMVWRFPVEMETVISEAPGRIVPQVAGRWSWADPKTLVFCAEKPLPLATPFQTTLLKNRLRPFQGLRFAEDVVRTYHTQELRLTHARIPEVLDDGQFLIELGFSDSVVPAEVAAKLSIKDAKGNSLKCSVFAEETLVEDSASGQEKTRSLVRFSVRPITGDQTGEYNLSLLLKPRLVGISGPLGMTKEERRELCLPKSLRLERVSASCPIRGNPELYLHFSERIDTEVLRRALKVEPAVPFTVSSCWQGAELRGAFQPGTRYVVSVLPRPSQEKIQTWPIADSLGVEVPDRHPGVWFDIKEGYLGSKGNRSVLVHAVNVSEVTVQVEKLVPEQVVAWCASDEIAPFAKTILTTQIPVPAGSNKIHDLRLSLDTILPNADDGVYQFRVFVAPERVTVSRYDSYWIHDDVALVSLSDLALSAQSGPGGVHAWTLSLATAKPQSGVKLRAYSQKGQLLGESLSDAQGLAQIPCTPEIEIPAFLLAERAEPNQSSTSPALTWLDLRHNQLRDERVNTSGRPYLRQGYEAFVFTDRGVYRPGDTVHLRTLVRGPDGQTPKPFPLQIRVLRPDLRVWQTKTLLLDTGGDTETKLELPTDLPTGYWTIHCGLPGETREFGIAGFQIEDFLPDRLKTSLVLGKPGMHRIQQSTSASTIPCQVQGDWLFGQPAAGQATSLDIRLDPERFSPPDWKEWTFGDNSGAAQCLGEKPLIGQRLHTHKDVLDTKGIAQWNINVFLELSKADYYTPWRLTASAGVSEISGRTKTMTNTLSIDPVENYLGLRLSGGPKIGEPIQFRLAMVDTQGKQSATNCQVAITLLSETWESVLVEEKKTCRYESKRRLTPVGDSRFVTISQGQGNLSLTIPNAGSYVLFARVPGTQHLCTLPFWIASDGWNSGSYCRQKPESCEIRLVRDDRVSATQALIIPPETNLDPKLWKTGERCALVIRSPFAGQVLVRVATDRVVHSTVITMQGTSAIVPLTVGNDWSPNAWILVSVVRPVEPDKPWRVHRAFGIIGVNVAQPERQALVRISPVNPVRSGEDLSCTISVSSSIGTPIANAALAVSIVDEGILSLTRFETPDPLAFFTAQRALSLSSDDCYRDLMPEVPKGASTVGGDTERTKSLGHKPPIASRRVKPVTFWHGNLRTDAQGQVQVHSTIPKTFAGQLRIMAIADAGPACGSSATTTVIRGPLVLQSSWPRALAPGDTFQVPIAVFSEIKSATVSFVVQAPEKLLRIVPCSGSIAVGSDGRGQTVLQATTLNAVGSASIAVMVQDTASAQTAWEELEIPSA